MVDFTTVALTMLLHFVFKFSLFIYYYVINITNKVLGYDLVVEAFRAQKSV